MKTIYTIIILKVFGGVEEVYDFGDKVSADEFTLGWCNGGDEKFTTAEEGLDWFRDNQDKVDFTIHLVETNVAFDRDDFMAYFRSETFHESVSVDDAKEIFRSVLHGSSDITKELLTETASDYEVNILELFSVKDLMDEIARRAVKERVVESASSLSLMTSEKAQWGVKHQLHKSYSGVDIGNDNYYVDPQEYVGESDIDDLIKKANEFGIGLINVY